MAAQAQEKTAALASLRRQQEADRANEAAAAREVQGHEEAAVSECGVGYVIYYIIVYYIIIYM